jgi:hypothetical protein
MQPTPFTIRIAEDVLTDLPYARRSARSATMSVSWRLCARLNPLRRPSTTLVGWYRSLSL